MLLNISNFLFHLRNLRETFQTPIFSASHDIFLHDNYYFCSTESLGTIQQLGTLYKTIIRRQLYNKP